jgi:hypothetical protein
MNKINKELHFATQEHDRVVTAILARDSYSEREMEEVYRRARIADNMANMYFAKTDKEQERVDENKAAQTYTPIYVPYSFALMLTAHTYEVNALIARDPIFQYTGRHGETQDQTQTVEAITDYQVRVGRMIPKLFGWTYDKYKYGLGVMGVQWEEEIEYISEYKEMPVTFAGVPLPGKTKKVKVKTTQRGYLGNKAFNIRPYDWRPDPSVPLVRFQEGEFCGHVGEISWTQLIKGGNEGRYINIEAAKKWFSTNKTDKKPAGDTVKEPTQDGLAAGQDTISYVGTASVLIYTMIIIPKDWKLGTSSDPEKWVFELLDKKILIGCRPAGSLHNKYPYVGLHSEMDMHQFASRGMLEIAQPLNDVMTWLVNTHFFAIRRALNDLYVVDPLLVNVRDVQKGGQGGIIRKKPAGYGKAIRDMFYQVPANTVTNQHLGDTRVIAQYMQLLVGVNENSAGVVNQGGRKTATEVRTSTGSSAGRQQIVVEFDSAVGFDELSYMMLKNWQQHYTGEQQFRIAGNLVDGRTVDVASETIIGSYDFVPVDGAQPIDRYAMANLWKEFMKDIMAIGLGETYDLAKIAQYVMSLSGAKNTAQFKIVPDAQIQEGMNNGNLTPVGGPNNGPPGSPVGQPIPPQGGVGEPNQLPGMGASG